jgi:hypothetical protein
MTRAGSTDSFKIALFLIEATRYANFRVDNDSERFFYSMEIVATILVMQFPPKLSRRTNVIKESLYGMKTFLPS